MRVDKELFTMLTRKTATGIRARPDGVLSCDAALTEIMNSTKIQMRLLPLAKAPQPSRSSSSSDQFHSTQQQNNKSRHNPAKGNNNGKTKGKQEGGQGGKGTPSNKKQRVDRGKGHLPKELIGCSSQTPAGDNICYAFNINGCQDAKPGDKCPRGWHLCCKPGCINATGGKHSFTTH